MNILDKYSKQYILDHLDQFEVFRPEGDLDYHPTWGDGMDEECGKLLSELDMGRSGILPRWDGADKPTLIFKEWQWHPKWIRRRHCVDDLPKRLQIKVRKYLKIR